MTDIMVHYGHRHATGSSLCPRCGSIRTHIIGSSQDSTTLIMRCGACGERSAIIVCDPPTKPISSDYFGALESR